MRLVESIDRTSVALAEGLQCYVDKHSDPGTRVHVYTRMHPDVAQAIGVAMPAVCVDATYTSGVERDSLGMLPQLTPEILVTVCCATRLENYADGSRVRDGIIQGLWEWATDNGYRPSVVWIGGRGTPHDQRSWYIMGSVLLGPVDP